MKMLFQSLDKMVEESGAKSTDYQAQESAKEYSDKCVETAEKWAEVADDLWEKSDRRKRVEEIYGPVR